MNTPNTGLLSVIVPVYKTEKYLRECVDSILASKYKNIEIILVDDGSPDNSPQICDELSNIHHSIRVIHKPNGGLSSARNAGLEIANGDYIAFVDSDDYVSPYMFDTLIQAIQNNQTDMAMCDSIKTSSRQFKFYKPNNIKNKKYTNKDLLELAILDKNEAVWLKIYKRKLFNNIRFKEGIAFEDVELNLRLYRKCSSCIHLFFIGIAYFVNPKGITHQRNSNNKFDKLTTFLRNEKIAYDEFPEHIGFCQKLSANAATSALLWTIILQDQSKERIVELEKLVSHYLNLSPCPLKGTKKLIAKLLICCPLLVSIPARIFYMVEKALSK